MVQVYVMDITDLQDPFENPQIMEELDKARKEKIMKCKHVRARKQSLGAGLLLCHVLQCHGISEQDILVGAHGKPAIEGMCFNLSHSGDLVVCAVSKKPIGCDIEQVKEAPYKVADRFLNEKEKNYLAQFSDNTRDKEFYRLWTMKESYIKMTGEGLSVPLTQIELQMGTSTKIWRDGALQNCCFREYELKEYVLTVCAMEEAFSENLNIVMTK